MKQKLKDLDNFRPFMVAYMQRKYGIGQAKPEHAKLAHPVRRKLVNISFADILLMQQMDMKILDNL